ncbi:unnamed protein product, partial [Staurois parvus]
QDPAFTISGPPQTLHSLYQVSIIHYIRLPHRTRKCNYFSKYKLLNTFSHQHLEQSCDFYQCLAEHWLKLVGGAFILP